MTLILIAALAETNRVIGDGNELPWHVPADLKRFKRLTLGRPLIMGRKTFDSLIEQFGKPLPKRRHIVMTRHPELVHHPVAEVVGSFEEALDLLAGEETVFIAGGAEIYEQTLTLADTWELTLIEGEHSGDAFFPEYAHLVGNQFRLTHADQHEGFRFETYERIT
ncbi:MAG: dihydrofolate reductase [Bacteroidota bacterium]